MLYNRHPDALFIPPKSIDPMGFGKVAIITGCSSGIGLACTQLLLAHQFSVCGLDSKDFNYELLREEDHGRFHFHRGDLTEPGACDEGVNIALHSFGPRVDVLLNVAGVLDNFSSADGVTDEEWDRVISLNLTVPVRMMRACLTYMRERKEGVIVNVASTAATSGAVAGVAYTSSKHGLLGATKNVAWRFRNEGIRCNAVLPGSVDSSIGKRIAEGKGRDGGVWDLSGFAEVEPVHALQSPPTTSSDGCPSDDGTGSTHSSSFSRSISPLDVAKTIFFLVSDHSKTLNGISLPVDRAWAVV